MATEYGLMVTLISVLVGGLVAAFGAHLIRTPHALPGVLAGGRRRGLDPAGGPGPRAGVRPPAHVACAVGDDGAVLVPVGVPCPSLSVDATPADTCPSPDPSGTATTSHCTR